VQLSSAREAENRWRYTSVDGIAGRQFRTRVGEGRTWAREAEESALLEAVVRERLIRYSWLEKGLACAVVNCKVWEISGSAVIRCSYEWSINPISNPCPVI
jgi:hypothetical protein